jgi:hypothetical protein
MITANHDRLKLCQDREVPEWAQKLSQQIIKGTGYNPEMFPGLTNISSAGSPISLPNIIILGVYPVLLYVKTGKFQSGLKN